MVPFFVVDRPISLEIIKGLRIPKGKRIGLMAHTNTSANFRKAFRHYPKDNVIKMCDSAIFHSRRHAKNHTQLFEAYEDMGADYGVIIDFVGDAKRTQKSAKLALRAYDPKIHHFKLVGVAQGTNVQEYVESYSELMKMGYSNIAVGGLLKRRERSARYLHVRDEILMSAVLSTLRKRFCPEWLFVLGCLHPTRLELFKELDVWGDYKGWIFEYQKRDQSLQGTIGKLRSNHLAHASSKFISSKTGADLHAILAQRARRIQERSRIHSQLLTAKRELRDFTSNIHQRVLKKNSDAATTLAYLRSRALLANKDLKLISEIIYKVGEDDCSDKLASLSTKTRKLKNRLIVIEKAIAKRNTELLRILEKTQQSRFASLDLKSLAAEICSVLSVTEQDHRIGQVRNYIESTILKAL